MIGSGTSESDGMEGKVEKEQPVCATLAARTGYANDCIPLEHKSNVTVVTAKWVERAGGARVELVASRWCRLSLEGELIFFQPFLENTFRLWWGQGDRLQLGGHGFLRLTIYVQGFR
jgi:hypothetical protein